MKQQIEQLLQSQKDHASHQHLIQSSLFCKQSGRQLPPLPEGETVRETEVKRKERGTAVERKEGGTEGETARETNVKRRKAGTEQSLFTCLEDGAGWMGA